MLLLSRLRRSLRFNSRWLKKPLRNVPPRLALLVDNLSMLLNSSNRPSWQLQWLSSRLRLSSRLNSRPLHNSRLSSRLSSRPLHSSRPSSRLQLPT